ncbi:hypothetical protein ABIA35_005622 [Catenulispora sp. MAP12-49]|jgi:hypothetical protein|uniref:hypothetical protein n=1 Tax=unclassified Catenulispora TaxID=414885 RepID=UPI00351885DA
MYWVLLIAITAVLALVITAAFGLRVFAAAKGLIRELKTTTTVLNDASQTLRGVQEMEGVKAMRARAQHD